MVLGSISWSPVSMKGLSTKAVYGARLGLAAVFQCWLPRTALFSGSRSGFKVHLSLLIQQTHICCEVNSRRVGQCGLVSEFAGRQGRISHKYFRH